MGQLRRVFLDLAMVLIIGSIFYFNLYETIPAPLQLVFMKTLLVSTGLFHAHLTRKLLFKKVNWDETTLKGRTLVAIGLYIIIPVCYAFAG